MRSLFLSSDSLLRYRMLGVLKFTDVFGASFTELGAWQ